MGPAAAQAIEADLKEAAEERYLNYALSVITSRALPDVRDGLKPVQRRILYAMYQNLHLTAGCAAAQVARRSSATCSASTTRTATSRPTRRWCAWRRSSRCATRWCTARATSARSTATAPAAMRYTEARLTALAEELLARPRRTTPSPSAPTTTRTLDEPIVLPARSRSS